MKTKLIIVGYWLSSLCMCIESVIYTYNAPVGDELTKIIIPVFIFIAFLLPPSVALIGILKKQNWARIILYCILPYYMLSSFPGIVCVFRMIKNSVDSIYLSHVFAMSVFFIMNLSVLIYFLLPATKKEFISKKEKEL